MDLQIVHVRINDAATGQPTPVRIRFVDATGRYRAPLGRLDEFPAADRSRRSLACGGGNVELDGKMYAYIDGACEILLPTGLIDIEVSKGFEYAPLQHTWDRKPGQVSLRLQIERKFNLAAEGWYAGDICAHFLSPQAAWLEGAAEGLSVVNLLAAEWEVEQGGVDISVCAPRAQAGMPVPLFHTNLLDFTGQQEPPKKDGTLVAVNTLNRGGPLGDFLLLNSHRPVFPLRLGQEGFEQYTPLDWCRQCHRKGGLVASTRFPDDPMFYEQPFQCSVNALAWTPDVNFARDIVPEWYAALNRGKMNGVAVVGGSAKADNSRALGAYRTYAYVSGAAGSNEAGRVNYGNWMQALRGGQTLATRGPLISFTVGTAMPGTTGSFRGPVTIRARACSLVPYDRLDVVCNGEIVGVGRPDGDGVAVLEFQHALSATSWLAARCWGMSQGDLMAHTTPLWLADAGSATHR